MSFFFLLLIVSGFLSFYTDERVNGYIFIIIACINICIGVYQEFRSSIASQSLQNLLVPTAHIIRDGNIVILPTDQIVEGDIIQCTAGDVFPVDTLVYTTTDAMVDNSVRTGESVPKSITA